MRGGEGRGEEGGWGGRDEGEGREGGRGGMTVIHILMAPQFLKKQSRHVLRNNVCRCLRRTTMVRNYVRRDVDTRTDRVSE